MSKVHIFLKILSDKLSKISKLLLIYLFEVRLKNQTSFDKKKLNLCVKKISNTYIHKSVSLEDIFSMDSIWAKIIMYYSVLTICCYSWFNLFNFGFKWWEGNQFSKFLRQKKKWLDILMIGKNYYLAMTFSC